MKFLFPYNDSLENKVTFCHLLLFIISLPFDRFYSQVFLISFVAHTLIHLKKERLQKLFCKELILLQSVFLITALSTIYSSHIIIAFGFWEKQLAIFLFPILLLLNPIQLKKYTPQLLGSFVLINTLVVFYLYIDAFRTIHFYNLPFKSIASGLFLSHNFSAPIGLHATYCSLFIALAFLFIVHFILDFSLKKWLRFVLYFCAPVMLLALIQLASKAVLIAFGIAFLLLTPFYLSPRKRIQFFIIALIAIIGVGVVISKVDSLHQRLITSIQIDLSTQTSRYSTAEPRAKRWKLAWQLIKQAPVIGHGSGEEIILLREEYFKNKYYDSYLNKLNAHNQYLSILLKSGVVGLLFFLFTLFYFFWLALRGSNYLLSCVVILITIVSLSENILDVNKGIFFYSFFLSFFVCLQLQESKAKKQLTTRISNHLQPNNVFITNEIIA